MFLGLARRCQKLVDHSTAKAQLVLYVNSSLAGLVAESSSKLVPLSVS
jgi:hypothetical protein